MYLFGCILGEEGSNGNVVMFESAWPIMDYDVSFGLCLVQQWMPLNLVISSFFVWSLIEPKSTLYTNFIFDNV